LKIKKQYSFIIVLLLIFLALVSLSFVHNLAAEEPYDVALKKALELDKDGFYEDAIEYWEKSLKGSPSNIRLFSNLKISVTYTRLNNLIRAEEISQALTESHPNGYESWFNYANTSGALKKYSQAISAFKKSIEIKPKEGLGKVGLAFAYFGDEKPDLAIAEFKGAMKIFKANKNISWYRDCRLAINQIKGFARFPPKFAHLWLEKNLKRVQQTFENSVLDFENILDTN
jgi:tetratricopeptide (TPR) repeat protein